MGRRENFKAILNHQTPDDLILDLGRCPLSTMQGMSMYTLLDHLGFPYEPPKGRRTALGPGGSAGRTPA